jgi:hypothetical protein
MKAPDNYREVWTHDSTYIFVYDGWEKNDAYYILNKGMDIKNEVTESYIRFVPGPLRFLEFDGTYLIFLNEYGIEIRIDPTNKITREFVEIYWKPYHDSDWEKVEWFKTYEIPYDKSFFKLGHPYMMRVGRDKEYVPVMLIEMDIEQMHFIRTASPDRPKDPGVKHEYIEATKYLKLNKPHWFKALMEGDVWSDDGDKEMAEDTSD